MFTQAELLKIVSIIEELKSTKEYANPEDYYNGYQTKEWQDLIDQLKIFNSKIKLQDCPQLKKEHQLLIHNKI